MQEKKEKKYRVLNYGKSQILTLEQMEKKFHIPQQQLLKLIKGGYIIRDSVVTEYVEVNKIEEENTSVDTKRKLDSDTRTRINEMYDVGYSLVEISNLLEVSISTIRYVLQDKIDEKNKGKEYERQAIELAFKNGMSVKEVCKGYGLTRHRARYIREQLGLPSVNKSVSLENIKRNIKILELYQKGYTSDDISYKFDLSKAQIRKIIKMYDLGELKDEYKKRINCF